MMLYVCSLAMIKTSICVTMLRIGNPVKALRNSVYALLGLVIGTFLATLVGVLCVCRPFSANWNTALVVESDVEGKAKCSSKSMLIGLAYFSTASAIATDLACAILPGFVVWNTQLKKSIKISVCLLLSFGSL